MNPLIRWALCLAALAAGWRGYGWPGVALATSMIVFWGLLQFIRSLRVLRDAGCEPVGHVPSAVMFHAKLHAGLSMMNVVTLTQSLGRRVSENPEIWAWSDEGRSTVQLTFTKGRVRSWVLDRAVPADDPPAP